MKMFVFIAALAAAGASEAATVAVRGDMGSAAKVIIRVNASACERRCAAEFADYVRRLTGVAPEVGDDSAPLPPCAVLIGRTRHTAAVLGEEPDWAQLGDDGFRVAARGGRVVIVGSAVRGAMYGTYDVLERFGGVDWLAAKRTVVPRLDRFEVPPRTDYAETPAFRMRDIYWWDAVHDRDFAAHRRLNGQRTHLDAERGGTLGKFDARLGSCHTFGRLVPVEEFFKDHPEYFSEIKGKRESYRTQLCLTNPDVLRIVTERVLARIREAPDADFYGVSQNDWGNFCTCAKCRAVDEAEDSPSGTIIRFVNAVAERVEREFPGKMVETLAYTYGKKPPRMTKPRKNVLVCLCSDNVDHWTPLAATNHAVNVAFADMLRGWGALTRNIYIWDYTTDFAHYLNAMPNTRVLGPNLRFFRDCGVEYMFEQGDALGRHGDFAELKSYLLSRYLWNPDQDEERLLDRFFRGYYGAGAPYARQYFDEVHALPHAQKLGMYEFPNANWRSDELLARADGLWQKALAATVDDPEAHYACRMGRAGVVYSILWRARQRFLTVWCTRDPERFRQRVNALKPLTDFFRQCQKDGAPLRLVENVLRNGTMERRFRAMTSVEVPKKGADTVSFESELMHSTWEWWGGNGKTRREKDRAALGGDTIWLNTTGQGDALNLFVEDEVAYDPGVKYRLRVRARAKVRAGAEPDAEVFRATVYNDCARRHVKPPRNIAVGEVKGDGYAWYDVIEWMPKKGDRIVIQPGRFKGEPAAESVWIDCLELSRCD